MTMWEKISSAATGISAFAAMIAAVVAMKQATKADEQYQILMEEYLPNMERMLDSMSDYDHKEMQLRPRVQSREWGALYVDDLWETPEIKAFGMTEDEYLKWIKSRIDLAFLVSSPCYDESECEFIRIEWHRSFRLDAENRLRRTTIVEPKPVMATDN